MSFFSERIKFNRNEFSGAFGDIGTDLPLIVGMLMATQLEAANALIVFGLMQILTAFIYGMPMPVQPLKAVAMIVITQKVTVSVIWGGGLAIGALMLILTLTGLIGWLGKVIPKTVIRGIQLGLGLQLSLLALKDYIPSDGYTGYGFATAGFIIGLILIGNRRFPPALLILPLGLIYLFVFNPGNITGISVTLPHFSLPSLTWDDLLTGFLVLSLPQIPLSLSNSVFATQQLASDYFPEKRITYTKIGLTYSFMNLLSPLLGGIPVCHGSGGIAGHYTFGGRTGGSTFIYGLFFLALGFFFSGSGATNLMLFPKPVLGVILLFEGTALMMLVKDILTEKRMFFIAIIVAVCANTLPHGYLTGMILGLLLYYLSGRVFLKHFGKQ
jgi:hypothetical protein